MSQEPPVDPGYANDPEVQRIIASGCIGAECSRPPALVEGPREAEQVGAARLPVDVSPTGNTASYEPQPVTEAPEDGSKNSYVQIEGGFLAGLALGFVPYAGVGHQVLDATHVLPHGSSNARLGLAVGQIVGGIALAVGGATGELLGGAVSVSGIGALVGVPAMAVSATLVTGGVGNVLAGIQGLMSTGSGGGGAPKSDGSGGTKSEGTGAGEAGSQTPIRNVHLAGKSHPSTGVPFDKQGFPDFRAAGLVKAEVKIIYTGSRTADFAAANKAAGLQATPKGMTWHHHQDGTTMQLVPSEIHGKTGHTGGFSLGK